MTSDIQALKHALGTERLIAYTGQPHSQWENAMKATDAALSALSGDVVTTLEQLTMLPDDTVIRDSMADVGVLSNGFVHYPETNPIRLEKVAHNYLPAKILYRPEVAP